MVDALVFFFGQNLASSLFDVLLTLHETSLELGLTLFIALFDEALGLFISFLKFVETTET